MVSLLNHFMMMEVRAKALRHDTEDFFGTGVMAVAVKHVGMTMALKVKVSGSLPWVDPKHCSLRISRGQRERLVFGCKEALLAAMVLKPGVKVI